MPVLVLLIVAVPFVELIALVAAARAFGTPQALVALILLSVVGAWAVKMAGLGVLRRLRSTVARGEVPHQEMVDGVLLLVAGALLLVPGFVTGAVGLFVLFPPSRALIRAGLMNRFQLGQAVGFAESRVRRRRSAVEADAWEVDDQTGGAAASNGSDDPPSLPR